MTANKYTKEYVAQKEAALVAKYGQEAVNETRKYAETLVSNLNKHKA